MSKNYKAIDIYQILICVLLAVFAFTTVYPFLYTLSISLSTTVEATRQGFHLYPREINFLSYRMVFSNKDILQTYGNTIFRTVTGVILTIVVTAMFAYPLSRKYMPLRKQYTFLTLFTMIFNGGMIPTYLLIKNLHLIDNRLVYVLPGIISAYNVIIVKNFFQSVPESLAESAKIDGASEFTVLFRIFMPLSKPVLATLALWTAVSHWNAWFDAMLYINNNSKQVLQILLRRIVLENQSELIQKGVINADASDFTPETVKSATIIVTILPIICVYPFIQKYFVKGIMIGSVKG